MDDGEDQLTGLSPGKARLFELLRSRNLPPPPDAARTARLDSVEHQLAEIWQDVLRVRHIERHHNYFRIGGDSIKSIQIAARARRLGLAVTTRLILENPTIARLAQALDLVKAAPDDRPAYRAGRSEYPLTPMQAGLLYETLLAPSNDLYLSCLVLRIEGPVDTDILRLAWNRTFLAHPALRIRIDWTRPGGPRQVVDYNARCDLVADVLPADKSAEAALQHFKQTLRAGIGAIDQAPLCRIGLLQIDAGQGFLVLIHHHIILDGWSQQLVLKWLFTSYFGYLDGHEAALGPLPDFGAFVERANAAATPAAFWREYLEGFSAPQSMPAANVTAEPARHRLTVSEADTKRLNRLANDAEITVAVLFQAVVTLALATWKARDDILFGLVVSGREADDDFQAAEVIGLCINTIPVRAKVRPRSSVKYWLKQLQDDFASLVPHHHASLAAIKRMVMGSTSQPMFDTLLVIENLPAVDIDDSRLAVALHSFDVVEGWPVVIVLHAFDPPSIEVKYQPGAGAGAATEDLPALLSCACTAMAECGEDETVDDLCARISRMTESVHRPGPDPITESTRTVL